VAVAVADMHTLKPLDAGAIERAARAAHGILVAEDHNTIGGLATAVADVLADRGIHAPLHRIGIPDEYAPVGPPTHLYRHYGLDAPGILAHIRKLTARG
jgi:transketolase